MSKILEILLRHPAWSIMLWAHGVEGSQAVAAINITMRATINGREARVDRKIDQWDLLQEGFRDAHISDVLEEMENDLLNRGAV